MNAADRSELEQVLRERCDTIVDSWYQAITQTSHAPHSAAKVRQHLAGLTEQAIAFLLTGSPEPGQAEAIGASLARLHFVEPKTLGRTHELLAQQLVQGLPPNQVVALQPRLAALLGGLAAGFCQQACEAILAGQEQTRGADVQRTEGALRMAREEEQHRVQEQTAELAVMNEKLNQEIAKCKRIGEALKESESRLSGILSSMIDLVFAFDSEGRFTFHHTPRVRDLYVPPEEFIGKRHSEVMPPYLNKPFAEAFEKNKKGEVAEYEYWLEICSRIRWFSAKLSPVFLEGEFTGSVAVIRESTERKRAEEVLREAHEDLERRVDERTLELALANEQLRQGIEERRRAEDELEQHAERLKILHEIDQGILAARSPKEVAQAALHYVRRLVPCLGAAVIVLDFEVGEAMVLCAEVNGQLVGHTGTRLPLEEFEVAEDLMRSLRQGEVHVVEDILAIPQLPPVLQILQTEGLHSVLNVPLIAEEEIIGVLSLAAPSPGPSVAEHVDIACEVAGPLAIAIQQARLFDKVRTARERLRRLARQIVLTQEEERQRLSRALHDEAGQALTALKINLELIEEDLPVEFSSLRQRIGDAAGLTDATMEQIRSLAQDLRPPTLDAVGLNPTLEGFCSDFAKRTGLSIDYLGLELPILPEEVNTCLYRFLQEALTNVAKHACANQVHVALCYDAETVHLSVKDDGRGFDKQARLSFSGWPMGIGLLGMQERLESLGGRLEIESRPGQGTRLVAYIPTGDIP